VGKASNQANHKDLLCGGWARFVNRFGLVSALFLGCALLLIVTMNPYGNLPVHAFASHVIMDTNDRYQYPPSCAPESLIRR
jgi:hypothetical protein